jgi:hypothetical protein
VHFLRPFSIENLPSTTDALPLVFKKQRGRPTTKRVRKGDWKRRENKCSKCGGSRHNIWKCRFVPAINGRQQRARERELLVDTDSSSESSGSESSGSDDLDPEDRAESNLYH